MSIKLFNHLTNSLEPVLDKDIKWYCCGPTVYDDAHIGHAYTYIMMDTIRRVFEYYDYNVTYCMNITDIDDKIINRTKEKNVSHEELINFYKDEFFKDMAKLSVKMPTYVLSVTDNIRTVQEYILQIVKNGYAYISNKSVYLDYEKYVIDHNWNILFNSCEPLENQDHGSDKKNLKDFCLWKNVDTSEDIKYSSEIFSIDGYGKPGWHIECSAMCNKVFGNTVTIHSGGIDLKYPHHNNEMVQNLAYDSTSKINFFIYTGHLHISGCKMSKSLKNFITVKDVLNVVTPRQLRLMFLMHRYNSSIDYSEELTNYAVSQDNKIVNFYSLISSKITNDYNLNTNDKIIVDNYNEFNDNVDKFLLNNIDTPNVIKLVLEHLSILNKLLDDYLLNTSLVNKYFNCIFNTLELLGLNYSANISSINNVNNTNNSILDILVNTRTKLRNLLLNKNSDKKEFFEICDNIRSELDNSGIIVEDQGSKSTYRFKIL